MTGENNHHDQDSDRRLLSLEDEQRYIRDDITEQTRILASVESKVHILASQVKTITDRRPQWQLLIAVISVALTLGALALSPVAWLAVNNYERIQTDAGRMLEVNESFGALGARVERIEALAAQQDRRFSNWTQRLEDRLSATNRDHYDAELEAARRVISCP